MDSQTTTGSPVLARITRERLELIGAASSTANKARRLLLDAVNAHHIVITTLRLLLLLATTGRRTPAQHATTTSAAATGNTSTATTTGTSATGTSTTATGDTGRATTSRTRTGLATKDTGGTTAASSAATSSASTAATGDTGTATGRARAALTSNDTGDTAAASSAAATGDTSTTAASSAAATGDTSTTAASGTTATGDTSTTAASGTTATGGTSTTAASSASATATGNTSTTSTGLTASTHHAATTRGTNAAAAGKTGTATRARAAGTRRTDGSHARTHTSSTDATATGNASGTAGHRRRTQHATSGSHGAQRGAGGTCSEPTDTREADTTARGSQAPNASRGSSYECATRDTGNAATNRRSRTPRGIVRVQHVGRHVPTGRAIGRHTRIDRSAGDIDVCQLIRISDWVGNTARLVPRGPNPTARARSTSGDTRQPAATIHVSASASATATPIGATDTIEDVPGSVRNSCTHRCAYGLPRFRGIVIHLGVQARCVIAALLVELIKNRVGSSFTLLIVLGLKRSDIGAPRDLNCTRARSDRRILDGHLLVRVTQVLETFRHQHRAQGTTAVHQGRHLVAQRDVVSLRGGDITHVEIRITHKIRHPAACAFLGLRLPRTLVGSEV